MKIRKPKMSKVKPVTKIGKPKLGKIGKYKFK
jgi:hypothetical protein